MSFSDVSSVTSHFATANEGFSTTTSGTTTSGANTVALTSVAGLTNAAVFVGVIEPGATKEQIFTGIVDTGGSQITGVVWTKGSNVEHATGVSVVDYDTGTGFNMMRKGILVSLDQDGTLKAGAVDNAAALANNVVTTAKILDGNVTTVKLASGAVTFPTLGAGATRLGLGRDSGRTLTTSYVTHATVTATSTGGVVEAEWSIEAANLDSGNFVTMDVQVLCDGVAITPASISTNLPFITGASPYYTTSFIMSSTPAAGSHTWNLQIKANTATSGGTRNNFLKIAEVV